MLFLFHRTCPPPRQPPPPPPAAAAASSLTHLSASASLLRYDAVEAPQHFVVRLRPRGRVANMSLHMPDAHVLLSSRLLVDPLSHGLANVSVTPVSEGLPGAARYAVRVATAGAAGGPRVLEAHFPRAAPRPDRRPRPPQTVARIARARARELGAPTCIPSACNASRGAVFADVSPRLRAVHRAAPPPLTRTQTGQAERVSERLSSSILAATSDAHSLSRKVISPLL